MLRSLNPEALSLVHGAARVEVPVARVGKWIAISLDYIRKGSRSSIPTEPVVFSKATSSLVGLNDPVTLAKDGKNGDWDRAVVGDIGRGGGSPKLLDVARCERSTHADRQHEEQDLQLRLPGQLR
jgi:2-keto-4-pentenoate hydratase/2-oxohepta-3-ene-1,7-dioic acid hydratase in catechol pathway